MLTVLKMRMTSSNNYSLTADNNLLGRAVWISWSLKGVYCYRIWNTNITILFGAYKSMLSPQSLHYDPLLCLQNHALPPQSLQSVKFALLNPLFSSSGPSSPCFIPIISPLEDPTHEHTHTHNTSSPTGLLQLSPKLLPYYTMQPVFPPTTLTKKAA